MEDQQALRSSSTHRREFWGTAADVKENRWLDDGAYLALLPRPAPPSRTPTLWWQPRAGRDVCAPPGLPSHAIPRTKDRGGGLPPVVRQAARQGGVAGLLAPGPPPKDAPVGRHRTDECQAPYTPAGLCGAGAPALLEGLQEPAESVESLPGPRAHPQE